MELNQNRCYLESLKYYLLDLKRSKDLLLEINKSKLWILLHYAST